MKMRRELWLRYICGWTGWRGGILINNLSILVQDVYIGDCLMLERELNYDINSRSCFIFWIMEKDYAPRVEKRYVRNSEKMYLPGNEI